jgi:hypothetical protein
MRARVAATLLVALLLAPTFVYAQGESPLALLMARHGDVTVLREGASMAGEFGMHLDAGDEIRTGEQSSADIVFATGQMLQLGANGRLVVQGSRPAGASGSSAQSSSANPVEHVLKLKDARGTSRLGAVRSGGSTAEILAVSPRGSNKTRAKRPIFRWSGGDEAGELLFAVEADGKPFFETTVSGASSLQYPNDAPALESGKSYAWRVKTSDPLALSPAESQTAFFEVLSHEEAQQVEGEIAALEEAEISDATRAVLLAGILYDHRLVDEAIEVMDLALKSEDADPGMVEVLENLRDAIWP